MADFTSWFSKKKNDAKPDSPTNTVELSSNATSNSPGDTLEASSEDMMHIMGLLEAQCEKEEMPPLKKVIASCTAACAAGLTEVLIIAYAIVARETLFPVQGSVPLPTS